MFLYTDIPQTPGSPSILDQKIIPVCHNGSEKAPIAWTQPIDTGGKGVIIEYYLVNVTGPAGFTCPPAQCNVTTTETIITKLTCDVTYSVTVRAVSCNGVGNISNSLTITFTTNSEPLMPSCM